MDFIKFGRYIDELAEKQGDWDEAVKACIKITVFDAGGHPGPQVSDMRKLLKTNWDWRDDPEFIKMLTED